MSTNNDPLDLNPAEFDVSRAVRGKYVELLGGPDAEWVKDMTEKDALIWITESLRHLQRFEGWLVAYFALLHNLQPKAAGIASAEALENPQSPYCQILLKDLEGVSDANESRQLVEQIRQVFEVRNWVIHRSMFPQWEGHYDAAEFANRMTNAAHAARKAQQTLYWFLLNKCESVGIPPQEARSKAEAAIQEWAAA